MTTKCFFRIQGSQARLPIHQALSFRLSRNCQQIVNFFRTSSVERSPSAHHQSPSYQLPVTCSRLHKSPPISTHPQPIRGSSFFHATRRCPEWPTSFVINLKNNNNTEMKVKHMRTTTLNDVRPINRFAKRQSFKLAVDFKPGRSSVLPVYIVATREYLRYLRAAEMKEWERSGGDFLAS